MRGHDDAILGEVLAAVEHGAPHGVRPTRYDGVVGANKDGEVEADAVIGFGAVADEKEISVIVLQVLASPLHVVRHVQEGDVLVLLPERVENKKYCEPM